MGSEHNKKKEENTNINTKKTENNSNGTGEDYFLEEWEVYNDKNINIDNSVKFDNDLLISEVKKDPFTDYEIIKTLGEGAFGQVHLVKNKITKSIRAMKVIKKIDTIVENNDQEVLNEINVLKKIDHPNVIKIFEFYISKDSYYLITEYCSEGDLFDLIKKVPLTEIQVAYVMYQIFSALNYCHKMKIIHRDLKPENILIAKNENNFLRIKICDFGTSQIFKKDEKQSEVVGSVYYIAPEVILKDYNFKCDLWSCGIMMYILLTRKIPFFGEDDEEIIQNIICKNYNVKELTIFSENTKDLIRKLLDKDTTKRINAETALGHKYFDEFKVKDLLNKIEDEKIEKYIKNLKNYKRKSILQETTIAYLIHNNPELEEISDACKLFNKIDAYGKGKITMDDLYIGLSILIQKEKLTDEDIVEIFANLDKNKNNYVGYEEFVRGAIDKNSLLDDKVLNYAFKYFDKDNKGAITIDDISKIFKNHLNTSDINEGLKKIISEVDDGDGKITYDKFCKIMKNIII